MELSREKLVLFAGAGLLGGMAGWAAGEPMAAISMAYPKALLLGAVVGLFVGIFIGAIEGLSTGHRLHTRQGMRLGAIAGLAGGGLGLTLAEAVFNLLGTFGGRVMGLGLFGVAVGLGAGWVGKSWVRLRNGALGGLLGGALGGCLYYLLTPVFSQMVGRALTFTLLGGAIGFFIGLVSEIFKRGWLMVIRSQSRNAREGKEYPLIKARMVIGRAEECDVGLFGDQSVSAMHTVVERRKGKFYLMRGEGEVWVNRAPVTGSTQLKNGDRVEVGGTLFLFRERAAL